MNAKMISSLALVVLFVVACAGAPAVTPTPTEAPQASCVDPFEGVRVNFTRSYWGKTDFCKHSVSYGEFKAPGIPPDGIPPIDDPTFETVEEADSWLVPNEPVIAFELKSVARAYPLQVMIWHEIVNDEVAGVPVAVTFCPLYDAAIVFDRRVGDQVLRFGTTGNLRKSDLVMWDRQTESWWQQITGEALVGELTGTHLDFLPASVVSWAVFKEAYPDGQVLSRDTGATFEYGSSFFVGYDNVTKRPFFFKDSIDQRLPAMARVATIEVGDVAVAYPFDLLSQVGVVNDTVGAHKLVVFWKAGTTSVTDAKLIKDSRDIGASAIFDRMLDGQELTFVRVGDLFRDKQTGSKWTLLGEAVEGPLTGRRLNRLNYHQYFWFAWTAFYPHTLVYGES